MSIAKFEHVNVTVSDPKKTASMLTRLFGWKVRWEGPSKYDGYTVHVGTDEDYLALYALPQQDRPDEESYYRTGAVNHFGILFYGYPDHFLLRDLGGGVYLRLILRWRCSARVQSDSQRCCGDCLNGSHQPLLFSSDESLARFGAEASPSEAEQTRRAVPMPGPRFRDRNGSVHQA